MNNLKFKVLVTMFASIQVVLMMTPLGFIPIGPVRATTLHIPVILAGILLGVKGGAIQGLVFGMMSVIRSTVTPTITGFLFSPFAPPIGGHEGNIFSLVIALVPRILLGVFSAYLYNFLKDKNFKMASSGITALLCTLIHTFMVLSLIYVFFGPAYTDAMNIDAGYLIPFLAGIIFTNGIVEALLAVGVITALVKALEPKIKGMNVRQSNHKKRATKNLIKQEIVSENSGGASVPPKAEV